jgi:hypothetical protein
MSHKELEKLRADRKIKKVGNRKNRTSLLSKEKVIRELKEFEDTTPIKSREESVQVDEHVKMSDVFMRTGKYEPKTK